VTSYRVGGLLRCCVDAIPTEPSFVEGEVRVCPHAPDDPAHGVRFVGGAWQATWIAVRPTRLDGP
jgi:hypothetical protein